MITVVAVVVVIVVVASGDSGFDSDTASDQERFDYYEERVVELGGEPSMTSEEAAEVAQNFCDNDADQMAGMVSMSLIADDLDSIRAESIAKAESYCPDAVPVVESVVGEPGSSFDPGERIQGLASSIGLESNVGSDGDSISFDTEGEEDTSGDAYVDVVLLLAALEAPDRVTSRIETTRALDGTQEADWATENGDFAAFWTYHPDDGLNLTIYADS